MPIDLTNLNPVTRFHDDSGSALSADEWVEMRRPSVKESREFRKKATKKRVEYKGGQRFDVTDFNDEVWDENFWDAVITNWHINTPDGSPIPCTKENKLLLFYGSPDFLRFLNDCVTKLNSAFESDQEENEKN
jgi:hypothetical protein